MPQGSAHAGGQAASHAGEPGLCLVVERFVEILETVVLEIMAAIGSEAMDREGVADAIDGPAQERGGFQGQLQHRAIRTGQRCIGGLGKVEQHQHRQIPCLADVAGVDPQVGGSAQAKIQQGVHRGVDVDLVAILLVALANDPLGLQSVDDMPDTGSQRAMLQQNPVDPGGIALGQALLQNGDPVGMVQLQLIVPLRVVIGGADRLPAFQLVAADAFGITVAEEFALQGPDFLGIVPGQFAIDFVDHLHETDRLALLALAGGYVLRGQPLGLVGGPDEAVVIPVGDGHGLQGSQAGYGLALAKFVEEGQAQFPADADVVGRFGKTRPEPRGRLQHRGLGIPVVLIEQGAGGAFQQAHQRVDRAADFGDLFVESQPECLQAWEVLDRQPFDAGILEQADEQLLHRGERLAGKGGLGVDQMGRQVGTGGPVQFLAGDAGKIVEGVGQVNGPLLEVGLVALAGLEITGGGAQEEVPAP
ncbi:hypothetical protein FQZ97_622410 [compost metagenome]